jgi:hypothetical protein
MACTQGKLGGEPPARANSYGRPCPDWCTTDHGAQLAVSTSTGKPVREDQHYSRPFGDGNVSAVAYQGSFNDFAEVRASVPGAPCYVPASDAKYLAVLLEEIAQQRMTPARLRQLAACIRDAAALAEAAK